MTLGLTVIGVSATVLGVLTLLLRMESARGERIVLVGMRDMLDQFFAWSAHKLHIIFSRIGGGAVRVTIHYVVHRCIALVLNLLRWSEGKMASLQLRNKRNAKRIYTKEYPNHLDAIATHKEETMLSEAEKRKRRMH